MKTGLAFRFHLLSSTVLIVALLFVGEPVAVNAQTRLYDTNLIVVRVGNGVQTLSTGGNPVFLDQFTPSGSYVSSVAIPDTGPSAVVLSGNTFVDGFLSRSADRRLLTLAVYATNSQSGVNITSNTNVPRSVISIDALGNIIHPALISTDFTATWRSAVTDGNNNYWGTGSSGGVVYMGNALPHAIIENSKPNCRVLEIFNGSLYMGTGSTNADGNTGIYKFNGLPTSSTGLPAPAVFTNTFDLPNVRGILDFAVNPFNTIIYFADNRTYTSLGGGIQRWDYDNVHSIWINTYHLTNGLAVDAPQNIAVDWSGPAPVIFATTIGNTASDQTSLIKVTDNGPASPFTILATSGTSQVFRGVKFGPTLSSPLIIDQPVNQFSAVGGNPTFTVNVAGATPLTYQWRFNGTNLGFATNSSLIVTNAQLTNAGSYQVIITNASGSATSQTATLTIVTNAPIITSLTSNVLAETGTTAVLSVIVSSSGSTTYQWQFGNAPISGATNSALNIANAQFGNAGTYFVQVVNQYGLTLSPPATLTMFTAPTDTNVFVGSNVTFSIQVVGPASPTFQWRFDGQDIPQATDTSVTIVNPQTTNAGYYSVVCSVPGMTTLSSGGFLSVTANPTSNPTGAIPAPFGLINWWPFDGNLKDVYGSNDASPVAGVVIVNGEVGSGCYFDAATNTHLNVDGTPVQPPWTASCWIYHQNTPWVSSAVIGDKLTSLKLEQNRNTSKVGFTKFGTADYSFNYISPINTWVHLVWVSTTTNTSLYVDGVFQDAVANTINLPRGQIGADFGGNIDHTLGVIDELMLFNRALSASEIVAIYNAGSAGVFRVPEFVGSSAGAVNQFTSTIRGLTGKTLSVYNSTNLIDWLLITNTPNTTGLFQFSDSFTPGANLKFYKATQQ